MFATIICKSNQSNCVGFHSGDFEAFCLLGYNAVQPVSQKAELFIVICSEWNCAII
jgi:hypothetical protein